MKILLCAATDTEIMPTLRWLTTFHSVEIQLLITGIGLLNSTYALTKAVCTENPAVLLQAGIAGSLNNKWTLGDVVVVGSESLGDVGVAENGVFQSLFDMKLADGGVKPFEKGSLLNPHPLLHVSGLPIVAGVTVNQISTSAETINYYRNRLGAETESMEGAALHYVGLMENIPFLQLRSLSNFAGERNKSKWEMKKAITRLNEELQNLIQKLANQ